jgi:purine catabolism regulator
MKTSATSLKDLLRLGFSESPTWLVEDRSSERADERAQERAQERRVNWVAASLEEARADDLLLVPAEKMNEKDFSGIEKSGVCAVLFLGDIDFDDDDLPENMPVIVLPGEHDLRDTQRLLLTILLSQRVDRQARGARLHTQLVQLEAEGKGLEGLSKAMADISGEGILIQDKRGRVLADHPSSALLTIWEDVVRQIGSLNSLPEALLDRKRAGIQPSIVTQDIPGGLARLVIPIVVGEVARGYLSLVGVEGDLDSLDHLVAEQGAMVCAVEMSRAKAVREAEKRLKGDLLTVLLQENLTPRDARLWANAVDLDLTMAHMCMRFTWDASSPPSRRRLETIVNGEVSRLGMKTILSPMGTEVVCFCQAPPEANRPEAGLAFAQAVLYQGQHEYPEAPIRCGVGAPTTELSDWRNSFRQAGQALEMARRFEEQKPLYFPDLSVYRLLFQFEHNPELIAFQEEILGPLLSYEGGRELIQTLEAYFAHNGNLSQASEALFVHRNTLIYRLERIAEIADIDLDKPETRLGVQLALHIYRMRTGY